MQPGPSTLPTGASALTAPPSTLPPYTWALLRWSFAIGVIPPVVLVAALALRSKFLLIFVHVITGGTWTGFDPFMGIVMSRVMRSLDIPARVEVAKRLTPATMR